MTHKVILNGYSALLPGANKSPVIALGTAGSYGIERLQLVPDARWQGLTITATFHPAAGDPVRVFAGPDNHLDVPPEATAIAATKEKPGKIVFAGVSDGVQRISCDLPYIVDTHAAVEGQESSATPDVLAQAIAQTGAARDEAVQAAADANKAAGEAKEALAGIGDSVGRAEAAADRAEQASANIEGAAAEVEAAKTDALTAVENAKTEAVESVTAAGGKAVESVETVASASVADVNSAKQSALDAITSGKDTALNAVSLAQSSAVQAVQDAQSTGVSAVQGAQSDAETAISEAETGALENIATEKETSVKAVNDAGSTATGAIADAKSDALSKIETAKTGAVETVTAEGDKQAERVQAIFPAVTEDDDGKVPIVQNGAWTLGEVAQDAYTRAESDARYAPIESAIRPTANGNPAVCEDSVAWSFQGLRIYGKSTQDGTPSPENPVPIVSAGEGGSIALSITDGAEQSQSFTFSTPSGLPGVLVDSGGNYVDGEGQQWASDIKDLGDKTETQNVLDLTFDGSADENWILQSGVELGNRFRIVIRPAIMTSYKGSANSMTNLLPIGIRGATSNTPNCYTIVFDGSSSQLYVALSGTESLEEFKAYLQENPMRLLARLITPITTPLSDEEVAAYRALQTYAGTTVVSTAEPVAGIEARYVADPQKYIDKQVEAAVSKAITAAVKLSGGNT